LAGRLLLSARKDRLRLLIRQRRTAAAQVDRRAAAARADRRATAAALLLLTLLQHLLDSGEQGIRGGRRHASRGCSGGSGGLFEQEIRADADEDQSRVHAFTVWSVSGTAHDSLPASICLSLNRS